jgi:predicted RNA binding protein YcfA (HicA-like mRNA interferase family)
MSKLDKVLEKVMGGQSDANIVFDEMCNLLLKLGFTSRRRGGSHIIFQSGADFVNLQNFHGKVKSYQVRQVREILKKR